MPHQERAESGDHSEDPEMALRRIGIERQKETGEDDGQHRDPDGGVESPGTDAKEMVSEETEDRRCDENCECEPAPVDHDRCSLVNVADDFFKGVQMLDECAFPFGRCGVGC